VKFQNFFTTAIFQALLNQTVYPTIGKQQQCAGLLCIIRFYGMLGVSESDGDEHQAPNKEKENGSPLLASGTALTGEKLG
jgi:hypothetical protein